MNNRILLVEDEPGLVMTLTDRLKAEGYHVESASDGDKALRLTQNESFDLILLDVMLPGASGFEVLRTLRQRGLSTPVIMLTARGDVVDRVVGLKTGADDYMAKPFDTMELLARVEALLRRSAAPRPNSPLQFRFGAIRVDLTAAQVHRDDQQLELSAREFNLLRYFLENPNRLITRDELLKEVWGYEVLPDTRTVDVHITWLRQKLEANPKHPEFILTLRGLGYRFAGLP